MKPDDDATARELQTHLRSMGHHVNVGVTTKDNGDLNIEIRIIGPIWLYITRWLAHMPIRALRALTRQETP